MISQGVCDSVGNQQHRRDLQPQVFEMTQRRRRILLVIVLSTMLLLLVYNDDIQQSIVSKTYMPLLNPIQINSTSTKFRPKLEIEFDNTWIILTESIKPTDHFLHLCQMDSLNILVIGQGEFEENWRKTKCLYQTLEDQRNLQFASVKYLDSSHNLSARKNLAFLYAISMGANTIYDVTTEDLDKFTSLKPSHWHLEYTGSDVLNPFKHFGQLYRNVEKRSVHYDIVHVDLPAIEALMPSTDYEMVNKDDSYPQIRQFDYEAPPMMTKTGVFVSFVPRSKVYHKDSFWCSVLLQSISKLDELKHEFWQQRLLWELDKRYVVHSSTKRQYVLEYLEDYSQINKTVNILKEWKCTEHLSTVKCSMQLSRIMLANNLLTKLNYDIISSWIHDISRLGYKFPLMNRTNNSRWPPLYNTDLNAVSRVLFARKGNSDRSQGEEYLFKMCKTAPVSVHGNTEVSDILLLIVFNQPFYKYVSLIQSMYGKKFKTMAYCGDDMDVFNAETEYLNYSVTFIEERVNRGFTIYKCLSSAMKMGYNVSGVLMVSDDVLLNTWNVDHLPKDKPWTHQLYTLQKGHRHDWYNWRQAWGEPAFNTAWQEIVSKPTDKELKTNFREFEQRLQTLTNHEDGLCFGYEDIAYIPRHMFSDFIYYGDIFSEHGLFLEIAIAILIGGLADKDDIFMLNGTYLWGDDRTNYKQFFNTEDLFFHPYKFGIETKKISGIKFLCEGYLPYV